MSDIFMRNVLKKKATALEGTWNCIDPVEITYRFCDCSELWKFSKMHVE